MENTLYLHIAEQISDIILSGQLKEGERIPATAEIASIFSVSRTTAGKSIELLRKNNLVIVKRGKGAFVAPNASFLLKQRRKAAFSESYVKKLIDQAKLLGISKSEIICMVTNTFADENADCPQNRAHNGNL